MRIRKAWEISVSGFPETHIVYAETSSKARYRALLDIQESYPDLSFMQIKVKRAASCDVHLPDEHWIVKELSTDDRRIVAHAYGLDRTGNGYREHYCTDPGDTRLLRLAWVSGLFDGPHGAAGYGETPGWSGAFFYLTDFGKTVAKSMLPTYP